MLRQYLRLDWAAVWLFLALRSERRTTKAKSKSESKKQKAKVREPARRPAVLNRAPRSELRLFPVSKIPRRDSMPQKLEIEERH
jgi:hypothetical protein